MEKKEKKPKVVIVPYDFFEWIARQMAHNCTFPQYKGELHEIRWRNTLIIRWE